MGRLVDLLGRYTERDKAIRVCSYAATFLAGSGQAAWAVRLRTIASELSACRTVLRLFDDAAMLQHSLSYGWGSKERNGWIRVLELLSNVANQLFFPLEHISWLSAKKIIQWPSERWKLGCLVAWATALTSEILKAITRIVLIRRKVRTLLREKKLEAVAERETTDTTMPVRVQIKSLKEQERDNYLILLENMADFVNAISWFPAGILWSGTLSPRTNGLMGTIASVIKIYRLHKPKSKTE